MGKDPSIFDEYAEVTDSKIVITDNGSECSEEHNDDYWKIKIFPVESIDLSGREDLGTWNVAVPRMKKPKFLTEVGLVSTNPGKVAVFTVSIDGSPEPTVEWFSNGKRLVPNGTTIVERNEPNGMHSLHLSGDLFSSEVLCVARNKAGVATSVGRLDVLPRRAPHHQTAYDAFDSPRKPSSLNLPKKTSMLKLSDRRELTMPPRFLVETPYLNRVEKGQQIVLPAKISKTPNTKVVWYRNGKRIRDDYKHSTVYSVQSDHLTCNLIIRDADFSDAGTYLCRAVNQNGECHMKSSVKVDPSQIDNRSRPNWGSEPPSTLRELGTPAIPKINKATPMHPYLEKKQVHSEISFESTEDTSVVWYQDGKQIGEDSRKRVTLSVIDSEHKSTLDIMNVTAHDEGKYKVQAQNPRGTVQYESTLSLNKFEYKPNKGSEQNKSTYVHKIYEDTHMIDNDSPKTSKLFSELKVIRPASRKSAVKPEPVTTGRPVKLDVSLQNIPSGSELIWYKDGSRIYEDKRRVFTVTDYVGENRTSSLFISNVEPGDTGVWTCKVKRPGGNPPVRRSAHISVPPIIRDAHLINPEFNQVPRYVKHVTEYGSTQFDVQLHAHPETKLIWYKDGHEVNEDFKTRFHYTIDNESINSTLHLKNVSVADEGQYTIKATSPDGKKMEYTTELKVTEWTRPYVAPLIENAQPVVKSYTNQTSHIDFQIRGTPDTKVVWYKDGKRFNEDHKRKIVMNVHEDKINSSLIIFDTDETDTGSYTVRAINQEGVSELSSELKVAEFAKEMRPVGKPKREIVLPQYTKAQLDATFVARDDTKIVWYKGGKPVYEDFRKKVVLVQQDEHLHSSLVIAQPTPEDTGEYVARAVSVTGEEVHFTNVLHINEETYQFREEIAESQVVTVAAPIQVVEVRPPTIVEEPAWPLRINEASTLQLTGTIQGPRDTKFQWYRNEQPIVEDERTLITDSRINDNVITTLVVENVKPEDIGEYTLKTWNAVGEDQTTGHISVTEWTKELMKPVFVVTVEQEPERTPERHTAVMDVRIQAHPDTKVTWYKDGRNINEDKRVHATYSVFDRHLVYTLLIDDVLVTDAGQYVVKAIGPAGEVAEHVSELVVSPVDEAPTPPRFVGESEIRVEAKPGEVAQFDAQIEATADTCVTWFKDGVVVEEDFRKTITVANFERTKVACLSIVDVCVEDSGKYCLKAENDLGFALYTAELSVIPDETEDSFNFYLAPQMQQLDNDWDLSKEFVENRGMSAVVSSREPNTAKLIEKHVSDVQGRSRNLEQDWDNLDSIFEADNAEHFIADSVRFESGLNEKSILERSIMTGFADERQDDWEFDNDLDDVEPIFLAAHVEMGDQLSNFSVDETKQSLALGNFTESMSSDLSHLMYNVETHEMLGQTYKEEVFLENLNAPMYPEQPMLKALPVDTYVDWHEGNQGDWTFAGQQPDVFETDELGMYQSINESNTVSTAMGEDAFQSWDLADDSDSVFIRDQTDISDVSETYSAQKTETNIVVSAGVSRMDYVEWDETNSDDGQHQEVSQGLLDTERRAESPPSVKAEQLTLFGINADDSIPVIEKANELSPSTPRENFTETEHYEAPMEVSVFSAIELNYSHATEAVDEKLESLLEVQDTPLESVIESVEEKPQKITEESNVFATDEQIDEEYLEMHVEDDTEEKVDMFTVSDTVKDVCDSKFEENLAPEVEFDLDIEETQAVMSESAEFVNVAMETEKVEEDSLETLHVNMLTEVVEDQKADQVEELIVEDATTPEFQQIMEECQTTDEFKNLEIQISLTTEEIERESVNKFEESEESSVEISQIDSELQENESKISECMLSVSNESTSVEDVDQFDSEVSQEVSSSIFDSEMKSHDSFVAENETCLTLEAIEKDETSEIAAESTEETDVSEIPSEVSSHETGLIENKVLEVDETIAKEYVHEIAEEIADQPGSSEIASEMTSHETELAENKVSEFEETVEKEDVSELADEVADQPESSEVASEMTSHEIELAENKVSEFDETIEKEDVSELADEVADQPESCEVASEMTSHEIELAENKVSEFDETVEKEDVSELADEVADQPESSEIASEMTSHETELVENKVSEFNETIEKEDVSELADEVADQPESSEVASEMTSHEIELAENKVSEFDETVEKEDVSELADEVADQPESSEVASEMTSHETELTENKVSEFDETVEKEDVSELADEVADQPEVSEIASEMTSHETDLAENQADMVLETISIGSLASTEDLSSEKTSEETVLNVFDLADSDLNVVTAVEKEEQNEEEFIAIMGDLVPVESEQDFVPDEFAMNDSELAENICSQTNENVDQDQVLSLEGFTEDTSKVSEEAQHYVLASEETKLPIRKSAELQVSETYDSIGVQFEISDEAVEFKPKDEDEDEEIDEELQPSKSKKVETPTGWKLPDLTKLDGEDIYFDEDFLGEFALDFSPINCGVEIEQRDFCESDKFVPQIIKSKGFQISELYSNQDFEISVEQEDETKVQVDENEDEEEIDEEIEPSKTKKVETPTVWKLPDLTKLDGEDIFFDEGVLGEFASDFAPIYCVEVTEQKEVFEGKKFAPQIIKSKEMQISELYMKQDFDVEITEEDETEVEVEVDETVDEVVESKTLEKVELKTDWDRVKSPELVKAGSETEEIDLESSESLQSLVLEAPKEEFEDFKDVVGPVNVTEWEILMQTEHNEAEHSGSERSFDDTEVNEYVCTVSAEEEQIEELQGVISVKVEEDILNDMVSVIVGQAVDDFVQEKLYSIAISEEKTEDATDFQFDEIKFSVDTREAIDEQMYEVVSKTEESREEFMEVKVSEHAETLEKMQIVKIETEEIKDVSDTDSTGSELMLTVNVIEDHESEKFEISSEDSSNVPESKVNIGIEIDEEKYEELEETELKVLVSAEEKQSQFDILVYNDEESKPEMSKVQIETSEVTESEDIAEISCIVKETSEENVVIDSTEIIESEHVKHHREMITEEFQETTENFKETVEVDSETESIISEGSSTGEKSSSSEAELEHYQVIVSEESRAALGETEIIVGEEQQRNDVINVEVGSIEGEELGTEEISLHIITDETGEQPKPGSIEVSVHQESFDEEVSLVSTETVNYRITEANVDVLEQLGASTDHFLLPAPLMESPSAPHALSTGLTSQPTVSSEVYRSAEAATNQILACPMEDLVASSVSSEKLECSQANTLASQETSLTFEYVCEQESTTVMGHPDSNDKAEEKLKSNSSALLQLATSKQDFIEEASSDSFESSTLAISGDLAAQITTETSETSSQFVAKSQRAPEEQIEAVVIQSETEIEEKTEINVSVDEHDTVDVEIEAEEATIEMTLDDKTEEVLDVEMEVQETQEDQKLEIAISEQEENVSDLSLKLDESVAENVSAEFEVVVDDVTSDQVESTEVVLGQSEEVAMTTQITVEEKGESSDDVIAFEVNLLFNLGVSNINLFKFLFLFQNNLHRSNRLNLYNLSCI